MCRLLVILIGHLSDLELYLVLAQHRVHRHYVVLDDCLLLGSDRVYISEFLCVKYLVKRCVDRAPL